jgi:arsenite-transporting ATPase
VVDTAPTAHTLRLLDIPAALRRYAGALDRLQSRHRALAESFAGEYRADEVDALIAGLATEGKDLEEALRDPERTSLTWVTLPEALSLAEARDAVAALDAAGIPIGEIVVNRVTPPEAAEKCPACQERRQVELGVVEEIRAAFQGRPLRFLPAQPGEPRGLPALRKIGKSLSASGEPKGPSPLSQPSPSPGGGTLRSTACEPPPWLPTLAPEGVRLLLFGGKGGVGKTTCAAATALTLAALHPDRRILLLSTDPAHSLADVLEQPLGDDERPVPGASPNLRARELDAPGVFAAWRDRHRGQVAAALGSFNSGLNSDLEAADLLEAPPPGLDELVAMATLFDPMPYDLVVVDTAPTGHALRLLQMPALALAWDHALLAVLLKYREAVALGDLAAELVDLSRSLKRLQALLADPDRTRFVAVTRPAELPRLETERLLESLQELSIAVPAVVVNAVPPGVAGPGCRYCAPVRNAGRAIPGAAAIIRAPAVYPPPRGVSALSAWAYTWSAGAG